MASKIEQYIIDRTIILRTEKGMSQRELSLYLGVSKGFVAAVENPNMRAKYNINHLNELAKIFECSFNNFFPECPFDEDPEDMRG